MTWLKKAQKIAAKYKRGGDIKQDVLDVLEEAYGRGYDAGKRDAREMLANQLTSLLESAK